MEHCQLGTDPSFLLPLLCQYKNVLSWVIYYAVSLPCPFPSRRFDGLTRSGTSRVSWRNSAGYCTMRRRQWAESTTRTTPPESCYRLTVISKGSGESSPVTTGWDTLCIKAGSQYNATQCVALRRHHVDACRSATQH